MDEERGRGDACSPKTLTCLLIEQSRCQAALNSAGRLQNVPFSLLISPSTQETSLAIFTASDKGEIQLI